MSSNRVATRIGEIPFAGIRKVFEKAAQLERDGVKVIHFEIGRPDFDTPGHIKQAALEALQRGMVHYTPNAGVMELRQAIAESIQRYKSLSYDPATEIMVTAGGQEAMYLSLQALLEPGDEVLVPDPGYPQFSSCVKLAGGVPVPLPLRPEKNFGPDLDSARTLLTERTRAIIVNSPHNPTGAVLTSGQIRKTCDFARERDLLVLSDEAYDRILYEANDFLSPAALPDMKGRSVVWGSLSKTYAMTGWRIGYLAAPADVVSATIKVQQNVMLSVCSFAQAGAVAAIKGPQDCVDRMVNEFDRRRHAILEGIAKCPRLSCDTSPLGAFYVFAKHDVPGWTSASLADRLLEQAGVAAVPGSAFGTRGEGYIRISYAASYEDCMDGMERIVRWMTELAG
jgi:aspartate/methionine/tyrosine aminotransferase